MAQLFAVKLTGTVCRHLEALRRYDRVRVLDAIKGQLQSSPDQETRNRKPLRENPIADWELRVGDFRVLYEVDAASRMVRVVGVGVKVRNRLLIGGEEIEI